MRIFDNPHYVFGMCRIFDAVVYIYIFFFQRGLLKSHYILSKEDEISLPFKVYLDKGGPNTIVSTKQRNRPSKQQKTEHNTKIEAQNRRTLATQTLSLLPPPLEDPAPKKRHRPKPRQEICRAWGWSFLTRSSNRHHSQAIKVRIKLDSRSTQVT